MPTAMRNLLEEQPLEQPLHMAERMANIMIDCMYKKGTWKIEDLRAANFSYDHITRYLEAACRILEQHPHPSRR